MGVYDFFRGECPHCHSQVDEHPDFGKCGDIQTKRYTHLPKINDCFRDFYPGMDLFMTYGLSVSDEDIVIGPTCCCEKDIIVVIRDNIIVKYKKYK